jgi:Na+/citrate or Na+/malate symporter
LVFMRLVVCCMVLLLYGISCDMLGGVPLMFALGFPLGLLPRRFSVFVAYFAVGLALKILMVKS